MNKVPLARLEKLPRYLATENQLDDKNRKILQHFESILTVFKTVMKRLEGDGHIRTRRSGKDKSYGNVWNVILAYEALSGKLKDLKQQMTDFPDFKHFKICINQAWKKLDKYYQLLDETFIYYAALVLHSDYRWNWFKNVWRNKLE
jgi:hypothetical protein